MNALLTCICPKNRQLRRNKSLVMNPKGIMNLRVYQNHENMTFFRPKPYPNFALVNDEKMKM